jgi:sensor histidine kinase YesM
MLQMTVSSIGLKVGGYIKMTSTDNGPGISEDNLKEIASLLFTIEIGNIQGV